MMIKYLSTTRYINGGFSKDNYANFNLATHTGDDKSLVQKNRQLLIKTYNLPQAPKWLQQTHSTICLDDTSYDDFADSIITTKKNTMCCVLTADCLPIFAWSKQAPNTKNTTQNQVVGVAHAGWKGLFAGVIENFIAKFMQQNIKPENIIIEFGVALSQKNFIVDKAFYQQFMRKDNNFQHCFTKFDNKYKFDIYQAASIVLTKLGVKNITTNHNCTFDDDNLFSYRRDGAKSGRQAHLIWFE